MCNDCELQPFDDYDLITEEATVTTMAEADHVGPLDEPQEMITELNMENPNAWYRHNKAPEDYQESIRSLVIEPEEDPQYFLHRNNQTLCERLGLESSEGLDIVVLPGGSMLMSFISEEHVFSGIDTHLPLNKFATTLLESMSQNITVRGPVIISGLSQEEEEDAYYFNSLTVYQISLVFLSYEMLMMANGE